MPTKTKKMTKAEAKQHAETIRRGVIVLFGRIGGHDPYARDELFKIANDLLKQVAGPGGDFEELLMDWPRHKYRPTLTGRHNPLELVLADIYDFVQASRAWNVVAYRG